MGLKEVWVLIITTSQLRPFVFASRNNNSDYSTTSDETFSIGCLCGSGSCTGQVTRGYSFTQRIINYSSGEIDLKLITDYLM